MEEYYRITFYHSYRSIFLVIIESESLQKIVVAVFRQSIAWPLQRVKTLLLRS